jgi:uroporphyrinogen-III synthase
MRVLVTRPAREAQRWVEQLEQRGIDGFALPLIEIGPPTDFGPLRDAWDRLQRFQAVMFVSGNAVDRFFEGKPAGVQHPRVLFAMNKRAWAPGPGTRDALLQAGVPQQAIDSPPDDAEQFDSEALWQQIGEQLVAGQRVLVVRGGDANGDGRGREWLAAQLAQRGVEVETVVAYVRKPPEWTALQFRLAKQGADPDCVWLFSSSEAIAHLRSLMPAQSWRQARAIGTHPRIAASAREAGFGVVCLSRPALADVVASIESMR